MRAGEPQEFMAARAIPIVKTLHEYPLANAIVCIDSREIATEIKGLAHSAFLNRNDLERGPSNADRVSLTNGRTGR
jgi:hypothetical protein